MTYFLTAAGVCCAVGLNIVSVVGPSIAPAPDETGAQVVSTPGDRTAASSPTMWVMLASGLAIVGYAARDRKRDHHPPR